MAKKKKLFSIEEIQISIGKSKPLVAIINVTGFATTAGWTNAELLPLEKTLSPDGILDLDLVAEPPTGLVPQVLTRMSASLIWEGDVERLIAVKVYSRTGEEIEFVQGTEFETQMANIAGFTPLPWPRPRPWPLPFPIPFPRPKPRWPFPTTRRIGEEGPFTQIIPGENGPSTLVVGEEGGKTFKFGEEGPPKPPLGETDLRVDDPQGPWDPSRLAGEDFDVLEPDIDDPFGRR